MKRTGCGGVESTQTKSIQSTDVGIYGHLEPRAVFGTFQHVRKTDIHTKARRCTTSSTRKNWRTQATPCETPKMAIRSYFLVDSLKVIQF